MGKNIDNSFDDTKHKDSSVSEHNYSSTSFFKPLEGIFTLPAGIGVGSICFFYEKAINLGKKHNLLEQFPDRLPIPSDIKHYLNPLHEYCRLRDLGLNKKHAVIVSRWYERSLGHYFNGNGKSQNLKNVLNL